MELRCLADLNGPFFAPDRPFRNWSAFPYYQTDQPQPPYVDCDLLAWGLARAKAQLIELHAQGYTGVVLDNLAHLVGFEQSPTLIYAESSPFRRRAAIYRTAFSELFSAAAALGMEVFVTADMQWSTPPLRRAVGALQADNPRLAELNRLALEELFTSMPQVQGLVIRVGETGGAHDQGDDYTGHMIYTSPAELRSLLKTLLPVCERHGRLLVVRSWSIGIGELGDLLWSPERYHETFGGLSSSSLIVSIKHGPADFFRFLPPNPTLGNSGPPQVVELQNRREYELFGMVPSSVAELHRASLRHNLEHNRNFAGIWAWNSTGGWGGGTAAIGERGWSLWTELSSALTARLLREPDLDSEAFVRAWCAERLKAPGRIGDGETARPGDRETGRPLSLSEPTQTKEGCQSPGLPVSSSCFADAVADFYLASASLFERGWYGGAPAQGPQLLGGVYLPPLLWVWWMRPTASLLIWAYLASSRETTLVAGAAAQAEALAHAERLAALAPPDDARAAMIVASARYLASAIEVAQALRGLLLPALTAAWANQRDQWAALRPQMREAAAAIARHRAAWAGRTDLPALELDEVAALVESLRRRPGIVWTQAQVACALAHHLRSERAARPRLRLAGMVAAAALLGSLVARRRRVGLAGTLLTLLLMTPLRQRALGHALPWLNQHLRLLPSIFFEAGPSFTEWAS